jgi:hypothetical protein
MSVKKAVLSVALILILALAFSSCVRKASPDGGKAAPGPAVSPAGEAAVQEPAKKPITMKDVTSHQPPPPLPEPSQASQGESGIDTKALDRTKDFARTRIRHNAGRQSSEKYTVFE